MSEESNLVDRVALITGGGSGVGRATAVALAGVGMATVLIGRGEAALAESKALVEAAGGASLALPADVSDEAAIALAVETARRHFGQIDALIMAAGIGRYGPIEPYSLADWEATLATNLTGVFICSRAVLPHLRERGGGAIIAIGSGAGKQGYANLAAYAASKFGLMGFMQSLAAEVKDEGIKVSTIVPGSILTDFAGRSADAKRAAVAADPGKRYLEAADVAAAVLFLLRQPARAWTQELNLWPF